MQDCAGLDVDPLAISDGLCDLPCCVRSSQHSLDTEASVQVVDRITRRCNARRLSHLRPGDMRLKSVYQRAVATC